MVENGIGAIETANGVERRGEGEGGGSKRDVFLRKYSLTMAFQAFR